MDIAKRPKKNDLKNSSRHDEETDGVMQANILS